MLLIKDVWYTLRVKKCFRGHPQTPWGQWGLRAAQGDQPKSSWNQIKLLIKVDRYDSLMIKNPLIGGLT